jgi:tRNA (cytidine/uridine-2'-O-)-methyltransferase
MSYQPRLHVVLFNPEIPPNTGAVGRTCVALEAKLWLVRPLGFRLDEKTLRRAGLDYWQHLQWQVADNWDNLLTTLGCQTPGTCLERFWFFSRFAERDFRQVKHAVGDVLVFGGETAGLPASMTHRYSERMLRIPTSRHVRSLNLASAVAVAGYEWLRDFSV